MDKAFYLICQELYQIPKSIGYVLLVYIMLISTFAMLSSNHPLVWQEFLPTLLMGLSYAVMGLSLDQIFKEDWEDGTLEWWVSESKSLEIYVLVKAISHWFLVGLPLTIIVAVISGFSCFQLVLGTAFTTFVVTMLGAVVCALCLNAKNNTSILLSLLVLPFGIPMMIVSMAAISYSPTVFSSYFLLQGGILLMSVALSMVTCPFALRLSLR